VNLKDLVNKSIWCGGVDIQQTRCGQIKVVVVVRHGYVTSGRSSSISTTACTTAMSFPVAAALLQPCLLPRLRRLRPQQLYLDYVVCRDITFRQHSST
jgi:hypothetical protein